VIRGLFKGDISFASVHRMKCTFSTWVRFFKQFAPMNMMIKVDLSDEIHFIVVLQSFYCQNGVSTSILSTFIILPIFGHERAPKDDI